MISVLIQVFAVEISFQQKDNQRWGTHPLLVIPFIVLISTFPPLWTNFDHSIFIYDKNDFQISNSFLYQVANDQAHASIIRQ